MTSNHEVRCAECDLVLDEPSDRPKDGRSPCPDCGSTARRVSITLDVTATGDQSAPKFQQRAVGRAEEIETALPIAARVEEAEAVLPLVARRLEWLEPTGPEGSYTLMVYGEDEELLGMTEDPSWRKALYGLRHKLGPDA